MRHLFSILLVAASVQGALAADEFVIRTDKPGA